MATYIQGLTDYIPQIQPFQPDLNFYGNVMQTRQTRFDAATKKVNDYYGSLLYSPLSRDSNIKRRDEFFKVIDNDIKRISGMDLSLKQNEDQAMTVFKGFTEDKYMVADMVKTKNAQAQLERGNNFKNCTDKEKCGGQYWDAGMQKLYYKMDEFKNVSDEESLNFQIGEFDPYFDWKDEAAKKAKDQGYDVSKDSINGNWIIKDSGGKLVQGGLYNFFKSLYGDDPRVSSNYDTMSYVARKNATKAGVQEFGSEEASEKNYIMKNINAGMKGLNDDMTTVSKASDQVTSRINQLQEKDKKKGLTSREKEALAYSLNQKETLTASKSSLQSQIANIQKNIDANDINTLRSRSDMSIAASYEQGDMQALASSLADLKETHEIKGANPYALAAYNNKLATSLADHNALLDLAKMEQEYKLKTKLEEVKNGTATGAIPTAGIAIEGAPQGIVDLKASDNPTVVFERQRSKMHGERVKAEQMTDGILFNAFIAAKQAVTANPTKSAGAKQYLEQFGDNWNEITNPEQLKANMTSKKLTSSVVFKDLQNKSTQEGNPSGDYEWAQSFMKGSAGDINKVKVAQDAFNATYDFNLKTNKRVVDKIKSSTTQENPVAKYADFILTENGQLLGDHDEARKIFVTKYKAAKAKERSYVSNSQADDAFDAIKEQFFTTYNNTEGVSLDQAPGQKGGGIIQATPMKFASLDSKNKGDKALQDITNTAEKALTSLESGSTVVLGDATSTSLKLGDSAAGREFINNLINATRSANPKKDDRPQFSATVSPIAAGSDVTSAITYTDFNPDFIKQYVGTKENPGILWKKDLSKGITVFYDNTKVDNPFKRAGEISAIETVLKTRGHYTIDSFKDDVGTVDFNYDKLTNGVNATINYRQYNMNTHKWENKVREYTPFNLNSSASNQDILISYMQQLQATNMQIEAALAEANKKS